MIEDSERSPKITRKLENISFDGEFRTPLFSVFIVRRPINRVDAIVMVTYCEYFDVKQTIQDARSHGGNDEMKTLGDNQSRASKNEHNISTNLPQNSQALNGRGTQKQTTFRAE